MGDYLNPIQMQMMGQNQMQINPVGVKTGGASFGGETQRTGQNPFMQEMAQVSDIGFGKKAGFENGLGGTSTPVDANGRFCKTWIA